MGYVEELFIIPLGGIYSMSGARVRHPRRPRACDSRGPGADGGSPGTDGAEAAGSRLQGRGSPPLRRSLSASRTRLHGADAPVRRARSSPAYRTASGGYHTLTGASSFTHTSGTRERRSAIHDASDTAMNATISTPMPIT